MGSLWVDSVMSFGVWVLWRQARWTEPEFSLLTNLLATFLGIVQHRNIGDEGGVCLTIAHNPILYLSTRLSQDPCLIIASGLSYISHWLFYLKWQEHPPIFYVANTKPRESEIEAELQTIQWTIHRWVVSKL